MRGEEVIQKQMRRRRGNESWVSVSRWVGPTLSSLDSADKHTIQKEIITGEKKWRDCGREKKVPLKQYPDVAFIFYLFLSLMFFQFNYSVNLINRYDCSACNLCARHLICSGSGHQGALAGIVFPLSWWPMLQISCCWPHYFLTAGGIWGELVLSVFHFIASLFCGRGSLIQKLKQFGAFCMPRKANLCLCKALF